MPNEDQPGHGDVVLINTVAWEKFFNRNPQALGSTLKLGNKSYTVIGVMPNGFEFPYVGDGPAVWSPLVPVKENEERDSRISDRDWADEAGVSIGCGTGRTERHPEQHRQRLSQARARQARDREELSRGADRQRSTGADGAAVCRAGRLADRLRQRRQPVALAHLRTPSRDRHPQRHWRRAQPACPPVPHRKPGAFLDRRCRSAWRSPMAAFAC